MNDEPAHILVIDDDTRLRDLLRRYLTDQGFRVTTAADAATARAKLVALSFDMLIVDVMMPGETGLGLTQSLRQDNDVPILLLTARNEPGDRIEGLTSGADDYLAKPFEPQELVLRIQAILRRVGEQPTAEKGPLRFGGFEFDPERGELRRGETPQHLTEAETSLLTALARRPGEPVSRDALMAESPLIGNQRTIDVQMTRLRRKIEDDPKYPRYLKTVRGTGYILIPD